MELMYCHNCNFQVNADDLSSGVAIRLADNKILCGKCAPLFQHTTSFFVTVPLPGEAQNTTHIVPMPAGSTEDEEWSRDKKVRVLVGAAVLLFVTAAIAIVLLLK